MSTLTVRVNDEELHLIQTYAKTNRISISSLIRDSVLDVIENDLKLDEERILSAYERAKQEKAYDHDEAWEIIGV